MKSQNLSTLFGHIMTVSLECGVHLRKVGTRQVAWHPRLRESGPQTAPEARPDWYRLLAALFLCLPSADGLEPCLSLPFLLPHNNGNI